MWANKLQDAWTVEFLKFFSWALSLELEMLKIHTVVSTTFTCKGACTLLAISHTCLTDQTGAKNGSHIDIVLLVEKADMWHYNGSLIKPE